jgi:hypothetical protein
MKEHAEAAIAEGYHHSTNSLPGSKRGSGAGVRSRGAKLYSGMMSLAATLMVAIVAACGNNTLGVDDLFSGEPRISDAVWFRTADVQFSNFTSDNFISPACLTPTKNTSGTHLFGTRGAANANIVVQVHAGVNPSDGNGDNTYDYVTDTAKVAECISAMKIVIDRRFEHWIGSFSGWTTGGNTVADVTVIGAGLAGSLAGGLTSQILNATIAGITGTKKAVQEDVFLTKSVPIIITQMKTDRAKWDAIIQSRLQATQKSGSLVLHLRPLICLYLAKNLKMIKTKQFPLLRRRLLKMNYPALPRL